MKITPNRLSPSMQTGVIRSKCSRVVSLKKLARSRLRKALSKVPY